eukprot:8622833-Pyramimonas_sp.AAC.1
METATFSPCQRRKAGEYILVLDDVKLAGEATSNPHVRSSVPTNEDGKADLKKKEDGRQEKDDDEENEKGEEGDGEGGNEEVRCRWLGEA